MGRAMGEGLKPNNLIQSTDRAMGGSPIMRDPARSMNRATKESPNPDMNLATVSSLNLNLVNPGTDEGPNPRNMGPAGMEGRSMGRKRNYVRSNYQTKGHERPSYGRSEEEDYMKPIYERREDDDEGHGRKKYNHGKENQSLLSKK
ncbi:hypothetical protein ACS0TY_025078 [Phlomoides rotata]